MMKHYCDEWIQEWCEKHGWTDPVMNPLNHYWAFPPGGVMPVPIPADVLQAIKVEKGLSNQEQLLTFSVLGAGVLATLLTYLSHSPMPLVAEFAFSALAVAALDSSDS